MDVFETEEDLRPFAQKPRIPRTPPRRGEVDDKRLLDTPPALGRRSASPTTTAYRASPTTPHRASPAIAQAWSYEYAPISDYRQSSGDSVTANSFGFERLSAPTNAFVLPPIDGVERQITDGSRQSRDRFLKMSSEVDDPSLMKQRILLRSHRRHVSLSDSINMRQPMKAVRWFPLSRKVMKSSGIAPSQSDDDGGGDSAVSDDDDEAHSDCNCELCQLGSKSRKSAIRKRVNSARADDDMPVYHSQLSKSASFPKSKNMLKESKFSARNRYKDPKIR
uniref:Uncharacterized protein n=1 Tax=Plectus sambesii TaxID=2011161 RepID=A0A914VZP6_9BILA